MNDEIPDFLDRKKVHLPKSSVAPVSVLTTTETKPTAAPPILPRADLQSKISAVLAALEGMLDDDLIDFNWSLYDFLIARDASANIAQAIIETMEPRAEEMIEVLCTLDEDLLFAYRHFTRKQLIEKGKIYAKIVDDAQLYIDNKKRTRKVVTKRRVRAEKVVKNLSYAQSYEKFKIVSIDPTKIVGANELWTYNTSNMVVTVYKAGKNRALTLQRGNVINYDDTTSMGKRVGRKTEEILRQIIDGGKRDLNTLMSQINTEELPPKRITKYTILLKVF